MPITVKERNIGRRLTGKNGERLYVIRGATDEPSARSALLSTAPPTLNNLFLSLFDSEVDELATNLFIGRACYVPNTYQLPVNTFQLSFDIAGQSTRVTQSRAQRGMYRSGGNGWNGYTNANVGSGFGYKNFKGAINVQDDGTVEGTEILVPWFNYQVSYVFGESDVDQAYILTLRDRVGTVNDDTFQGFSKGELLFTRVAGAKREDLNWDITFAFAVLANATNLSVGNGIVVSAKNGWDYLWTYYENRKDSTTNLWHKIPIAAYVEQVYPYTSFDSLNI